MPSARERDKSPRERVRRKPVEGERDEKKAKPASESSKETTAPPSSARQRLWLSLGSTDGFDNAGLLAGLESLGIAPSKVLKADVRTTYSYLMVAEENVPAFEELNGKAIGGKSIKIERAKKR
jgi:ATP-dependent RNA helicase DeaD